MAGGAGGRRLCSCFGMSLATIWVLSLAFAAYIFLQFLLVPRSEWDSVQDFSPPRRAYPILAHWVGGVVVLVVGPLQMLQKVRASMPWLHRLSGRLYMLGAAGASIGGLIYIGLDSTVGGLSMNISFGIYGVLLGTFSAATWYYARQRRFKLHSEWATRTFALGLGSALYRLLVLPLFLRVVTGLSREAEIRWLTDAGWAFWPIPLVLAELYIRKRRRDVKKITYEASHGSLGSNGDAAGTSPLIVT